MNGLLLASKKSRLEVVIQNVLWLEQKIRLTVFPSVSVIYEWFGPYKNYAVSH